MIELEELLTSQNISYSDHGHYLKIHCINPAHEDKNPSMTILKENGYARCWTCGARYSYAKFVYALTGESPFQTTQDKYSFRFNNSLVTVSSRKTFKAKKRVFEMNGQLRNPLVNKEVMNFLNSIDIDKKTIEDFDIKYMLSGGMSFVMGGKKTPIYNRVCIPLYENQKLVNYECRDFTGQGKPKVLYPKGGKSSILFNYDNLDFSKPLFIVEGIKSALRIYKHFTYNVTATLGASISNEQIQMINEMKYPVVFPDNDKAGYQMLEQIEKNTIVDIYVTFMPGEGQDPADGTLEELDDAIHRFIPVTQYYLEKYAIFRNEERIEW